MDLRKTIGEAWEFAREEKKLMYWYAFLPALIASISGMIYIGYQTLNLRRYFNDQSSLSSELAVTVLDFLQLHPNLWMGAIISAVIIAILYLLYPSFCEGALIQLIARKYNRQDVKMWQGLTFGTRYFFPLIEFNGLLSFFSMSALIGYATLLLRAAPELLRLSVIFFVIMALLNVMMSFLFTYAPYFIAIDEEGVFSAIGKSTSLVVAHWRSTMLVILLLALIGLRVIVNILLVLVIPGLIFLIAGFFASLALNIVGFVIAGIICLIGLFIAGYVGGILQVFSNAVWTLTFLKLTKDGDLSARAEM